MTRSYLKTSKLTMQTLLLGAAFLLPLLSSANDASSCESACLASGKSYEMCHFWCVHQNTQPRKPRPPRG